MKLPTKKLSLGLCLISLTALLCVPLWAEKTNEQKRADRKAAMSEFQMGRKLESQKKYSAAIAYYKSALFLDPSYYWAYKQIGASHYNSGNYDSAVSAYKKYLEAFPTDDKIRYFMHKLRKEIYSGRLHKRLAPKKTGRELRDTPFVGIGGGLVLVSDADVQALYQSTWSSVAASSMMPLYSLEGGYLFSNGFYGQVLLLRGMKRRVERNGPLASASTNQANNITFNQSAMILGGGWMARVGKNGLLGLQLGGGPSSIQGPGGTSGDAVMWTVEGRFDWMIGRQMAVGLHLGYAGARFDDFSLQHSGFTARLGLQWFLFPARDLLPKSSKKSSGQG